MGWNIFRRKARPADNEVIELDRNVALSEAASSLGRAGDIASKRQDTDNLLQVAAGWIELSHRLDNPITDDVESKTEERTPMGFTPRPDTTKIPEAPDPDVED